MILISVCIVWNFSSHVVLSVCLFSFWFSYFNLITRVSEKQENTGVALRNCVLPCVFSCAVKRLVTTRNPPPRHCLRGCAVSQTQLTHISHTPQHEPSRRSAMPPTLRHKLTRAALRLSVCKLTIRVSISFWLVIYETVHWGLRFCSANSFICVVHLNLWGLCCFFVRVLTVSFFDMTISYL